jgi:hypothetical protein
MIKKVTLIIATANRPIFLETTLGLLLENSNENTAN